MPRLETLSPQGRLLLAVAERIGTEVAGPVADDVDRAGRFPSEAVGALRAEGLLAALVPKSHGGGDCSYADISALCTELGKHCSSSAMIFAMHQIQVSCVLEHGGATPYFDALLRDIGETGRLLASATSEVGIGGDVRSSVCAVEQDGDRFSLAKAAPVISYGEYVDDVLVTARRSPEAPANDQVLVHVQKPNLTLAPTGVWDTIGMRGTCSIGFDLRATGSMGQVIPAPYSEISSQTMVPVSHITWASLWLGIAENAVGKAHTFVRAAARKTPGSLPQSAHHLASVVGMLESIRASVDHAVALFERARAQGAVETSMSFAISMNNLKVNVST
ncbi:MAG: acyl-CoA dehydrogenase family protein, partial [Ilumatobacteraceae bacterium]